MCPFVQVQVQACLRLEAFPFTSRNMHEYTESVESDGVLSDDSASLHINQAGQASSATVKRPGGRQGGSWGALITL